MQVTSETNIYEMSFLSCASLEKSFAVIFMAVVITVIEVFQRSQSSKYFHESDSWYPNKVIT